MTDNLVPADANVLLDVQIPGATKVTWIVKDRLFRARCNGRTITAGTVDMLRREAELAGSTPTPHKATAKPGRRAAPCTVLQTGPGGVFLGWATGTAYLRDNGRVQVRTEDGPSRTYYRNDPDLFRPLSDAEKAEYRTALAEYRTALAEHRTLQKAHSPSDVEARVHPDAARVIWYPGPRWATRSTRQASGPVLIDNRTGMFSATVDGITVTADHLSELRNELQKQLHPQLGQPGINVDGDEPVPAVYDGESPRFLFGVTVDEWTASWRAHIEADQALSAWRYNHRLVLPGEEEGS